MKEKQVRISVSLDDDVMAFLRRSAKGAKTSVSRYVVSLLHGRWEDTKRARRSDRELNEYMIGLGMTRAEIAGMTMLDRARRIVALNGGAA